MPAPRRDHRPAGNRTTSALNAPGVAHPAGGGQPAGAGRPAGGGHPGGAGQPDADMVVAVDRLVGAYYDEHPDPSDPAQAVSFGTSGHRGSSLAGTFTEEHIVAISAAIARYRPAEGIDGPLFLGRDTHALS